MDASTLTRTEPERLDLPLGPPLQAAVLMAVQDDGMLLVQDDAGSTMTCLWLEAGRMLSPPLGAGDRDLVSCVDSSLPPVVLGRIGRYVGNHPPADVSMEASRSLTMRCGAASLTLRADGQVLLKGEDVTVRAKGTQRIRAGNVAIN